MKLEAFARPRGAGARVAAFAAASLAVCSWLAACQPAGLQVLDPPLFGELDGESTHRYLVSSDDGFGSSPDEDVLALTAEMRALVREIADTAATPRARLVQLAELFAENGGLGLDVDPLGAHTAAETLARRAGNDLAFSHLFIALARELEIEARYLENRVALPSDAADAYVFAMHPVFVHSRIAGAQDASGALDYETYEIDFGFGGDLDRRFGALIDDDRARALHFNNRAAASMSAGDDEQAVRDLNRALRIAPEIGSLWSNLGMAYARLGDAERAELAYRQALRLDAFDVTAMGQLARLYRSLGEQPLAGVYEARRQTLDRQNPFRQFYDGEAAFAAGRWAQSVERFEEASRLRPDELHFHLELGRALALYGEPQRSQRELQRAVSLVERPEDEQAVQAALQFLAEMAAAGMLPEQRPFSGVQLPDEVIEVPTQPSRIP